MAVNKVVYGRDTLIDLSSDTLVNPSSLLKGVTAHNKKGVKIIGTDNGEQYGYFSGIEAYAPIIIQGTLSTKDMSEYEGTGASYAYDAQCLNDTSVEEIAVDFQSDVTFSMNASSGACSIGLENDYTMYITVYLEITVNYTINGLNYSEQWYKKKIIPPNSDTSIGVYSQDADRAADSGSIKWKYLITGARYSTDGT